MHKRGVHNLRKSVQLVKAIRWLPGNVVIDGSSEWSTTSKNEKNIADMRVAVWGNRWIAICDLSEDVEIKYVSVHSVITVMIWLWDACLWGFWENCFHVTQQARGFQLHTVFLIVSRTMITLWKLYVGLSTGNTKILTKVEANSLHSFLCYGQCNSHTQHTLLPSTAVNSKSEVDT